MVDNGTGEQVSRFTDAVAEHTEGLTNISVTSEESHFSWSPCDTCGSELGGDREDVVGFNERGEAIELAVCIDCAMYFANGDEPENWEG